MSAISTPAPSAEQLTRCGKIWDSALREDCEAILLRTGGYRWDILTDLALYKWDRLGYEVKADIARAMLTLGKLLRTAV